MPLQLENDNETVQSQEITMDASGHELIERSIPKMMPDGTFVSEEELAEQAKPETKVEEPKKEEEKNSDAEARKLFLQAQKAERRAKEMEKKASESLKKAEAFEAAKELAASGKDPAALLKAAGLDPVKFYRDLTDQALRGEEKPEDPQAKINRENQERLDKYEKENQRLADDIKNKEELAQHNKNIFEQVVPLLTKDPEKYEMVLKEYGDQAAVEVYKQVWELYKTTGETVSFEEAANRLEDYWYNERKSAIIAASKMKKFADLFAQSQQTQRNSPEQTETPKRSFTLSNTQTISAAKPVQQYDRYRNPDERAREILKKFGE